MTNENMTNIVDSVLNESLSRRDALKRSGIGAAAVALAGTAVGSAVFSSTASAQTASAQASIIATIKVKHLAKAFYDAGVSSGLFATGTARRNIIEKARAHEVAHITALSGMVTGAPSALLAYDFTAGAKFGNVLTNATTYFKVGRYIEDMSVRALKGAIAPLFNQDPELAARAARINTVDGRHAANFRIYQMGHVLTAAANANNSTPSRAIISTAANGNTPTDFAGLSVGAVPGTTTETYVLYLVYGPLERTNDHPESNGEDNTAQINGQTNFNANVADEPALPANVELFHGLFVPVPV